MERMVGPATWYVPMEQVGRYRLALRNTLSGVSFAESMEIAQKRVFGIDVVNNVTVQRKAAMRDAHIQHYPSVQIDDDLHRIRCIPDDVEPPCRWGKCPTMEWDDAITRIHTRLIESPYFLAGVSATPNPFFVKQRTTNNRFIISRFTMIMPNIEDNGPTLDPQFTIKEDYDHTIQHFKFYGGVVRVEDIMFIFSDNPPTTGCNDYRDSEEEKEMIRRLIAKWGTDLVRPNRRDPDHEVVLHLR